MKEELYVDPPIPRQSAFLFRRVSWGAIFSGLFVTIAIQLMLSLLGLSIGLATIEPLREQNPAQGLGLGSAIWLLVSSLIALYCGACVAGRLCGGPRRTDGLVHGIVTWSAATVATIALTATTAGMIFGGVGSLLSDAYSGSSPGQTQGVASALRNEISRNFPQAGELLPPTGRSDTQNSAGNLTSLAAKDPQLAAAITRMEKNGGAAASPQDRDQVINILTTQHGVNQAQATQWVSQWDQSYQQSKAQLAQKSREVGDKVARKGAQGAFWGFVALLLGGVVSAFGGWSGTASLPEPEELVRVNRVTGTSGTLPPQTPV